MEKWIFGVCMVGVLVSEVEVDLFWEKFLNNKLSGIGNGVDFDYFMLDFFLSD